MSRRERIDALQEAFGKEIEAIGDEAMDEIGQAQYEADAREHLYHQAVEELAKVEAEISAAGTEREELPDKAYRAGLDERYEEEDELKERYKNLRLMLEALDDRRGSLKEEIAELLPRSRAHRLDARIHATTSVARNAAATRKDMEHLRDGLLKAMSTAVDPVVTEHRELVAQAEQLNRDREWDLSPAGGRRG